MCRMIFATGRFDPAAILAAAIDMSCGADARHELPTLKHGDGWGALWIDGAGAPVSVHRSTQPLWADDAAAALSAAAPGATPTVLAIHARQATIGANLGPSFCHPLAAADGSGWHLMHNGYLPTVHRQLGLAASHFDSREYFDWVLATGQLTMTGAQRAALLDGLLPGSSSGNAIFVHRERAQVFSWHPATSTLARYYTMHRLDRDGMCVIASEPVGRLAPAEAWQALPSGTLMSFDLGRPQ